MSLAHSAYSRPSASSKTGRVWEIADRISRETGRRAARKEVIDAFVREGGKPNTAATQYAYWKLDFDAHRKEAAGPGSTGRLTLQINPDGRLLIPAEFRAAMQLGHDGKVVARVEEGELRVVAPGAALHRLQELVRNLDKGSGSAVDELLSERRAESRSA